MKEKSKLVFSHPEHFWMSKLKDFDPEISETDETFTWTWNDCFFSYVKISKNKIRIIVRSKDIVKIAISNSETEDTPITFTYDFDITTIPDIKFDENFSIPENPHQKIELKSGKRYCLSFFKEKRKGQVSGICEIWQWDSDSELKKIREKILSIMESEHITPIIEDENQIHPIGNIAREKICPIIYQPALDKPKNFLRQVHINKKNDKKFQITLVFNNEALRKHKFLDGFYKDFRKVVYGRTKDVETFYIILEDSEPKKFNFKGIYSKKNTTLENDMTHGDKKEWWEFWKTIKDREIDCYYSTTKFPKIYVNTANHALAGHDNNPGLWKWEYVTWGEKLPIGVGEMSREKIEDTLTNEGMFDKIKEDLKSWENGFINDH